MNDTTNLFDKMLLIQRTESEAGNRITLWRMSETGYVSIFALYPPQMQPFYAARDAHPRENFRVQTGFFTAPIEIVFDWRLTDFERLEYEVEPYAEQIKRKRGEAVSSE